MERAGTPSVGLIGTFDIANYGDQLIPAITELELRRRVPDIEIRRYAPFGWEHPVPADTGELAEPLGPPTDLRREELAAAHDAILIGGGEIIHRFDELLAPHYGVDPADLKVRAPSEWFTAGAGPDAPTAWNVVGVPFDIAEEWAPTVRSAVRAHHYVSVRDDRSRARIEQIGVEREIHVVPDPAFLLPRLHDPAVIDRRRRLHSVLGWIPSGRYIVVQGNGAMVHEAERMSAALDQLCAGHPDLSVVVVQTGDGHGDAAFARAFVERHPARVWAPDAPLLPIDVVSLISGADAFVGISLHGAITALAHGRRAVVFNATSQSKLRGLADLLDQPECYVEESADLAAALQWALTTPGPDPALPRLVAAVDAHFDRLAELVERSSRARDESGGSTRVETRLRRLAAERDALRTAHDRRGRQLLRERDALAALIEEREHLLDGAQAQVRALEEALLHERAELERHISQLQDERDRLHAEVSALKATRTLRWLRVPRSIYGTYLRRRA